MDILLIVAGFLCLLLGLIGSILPVLPGPPLAFIGLLFIHLTDKVQFTTHQFIIWIILVIVTLLADYILPVMGVRKWHGSRWGSIGCIAGTIVGLFFFPPWGIIIGPFFGSLAGELLFGNKNTVEALKSSFGALIGFIMGTVLKLSVCGWFLYCAIKSCFFI